MNRTEINEKIKELSDLIVKLFEEHAGLERTIEVLKKERDKFEKQAKEYPHTRAKIIEEIKKKAMENILSGKGMFEGV